MPQGQVQQRNAEMVRLLSADLQPRYDAAFAWSRACAMHLALPGLRGFWPMSAFDSSGNAQDQSGHAHHLTYNGNPAYNYASLAPYIALDGTGDFLSRADEADLDITGTESYVATAARGLTLGGWFWFDALGAVEFTISKVASQNTSYFIRKQAANTMQFGVTTDGSTLVVATTTATAAAGVWYFLAGRFDPSTQLKVWLNSATGVNTTGIPAAIFNGDAALQVSGFAGTNNLLTGRASLCWLCAAYLSDAIVESLFAQTRPLFGV